MQKRKTSAALALMISAQILASCGSEGAPETTTSGNADTSDEAMENVTTTAEIPDDLPEKNYDGKTFTVLTYDYIKDDYVTDGENGEVVNDSIYHRDQTVSERFGVNIAYNAENDFNGAASEIKKSVMSGDDAYQLVAHHVISMSTIATDGLFMNWYDVPYIDFSKPWWAKSTTEDLTYGGDKATIAIGDYALSALSGTYCFFYDKKIAEDYHLEDLYKVVNDGRWTLDYLKNTVKNMYTDLNGNGEKDSYDFYGLTQSLGSPLETYFYSFGGKVFNQDKDGIPTLVYKSERTADIISEVYDLCYETDGVTTEREQYSDNVHEIAARSFRDELTAFASGTLHMTELYFRDKKNEYGILPYPKLDETQKEYKTMVDGYHAVLAVPKTVQDTEFVGIITEALNAESRRQVFPAYYEVALKKKYTYDDESVKLLDEIVDSRVFDFGYVYDAWKGFGMYTQKIVSEKHSKDFESYYATHCNASIKHYDKIIKSLSELD